MLDFRDLFQWDLDSTYVREAPYFDGFKDEPDAITDIKGARAVAVLGDMVSLLQVQLELLLPLQCHNVK